MNPVLIFQQIRTFVSCHDDHGLYSKKTFSVKKLLEIIERTWEHDYQARPSFGTLENELRYDLYDFVGANCDKQPEINFEIRTHISPFVKDEESQYATHVSL